MPGMLERPCHPAESFTQAQRDGRIFLRPKAYLHSHKSLWALAWLDNAATLDRQDFQDLRRNATLGEGRLNGSLENPVDARDAGEAMSSCGKLHPGSKRRTDIFKTQGLPAQPQVIMGSGLVGQRGDSGQAVLEDVEER